MYDKHWSTFYIHRTDYNYDIIKSNSSLKFSINTQDSNLV